MFFFISDTSDCLTKMKERIPIINKVVIIIHGFLSHFNREWLYDMMEGIQRVEKTTAVIILGKYLIFLTASSPSRSYMLVFVFLLILLVLPFLNLQAQIGIGISKIVGPKKQDFCNVVTRFQGFHLIF